MLAEGVFVSSVQAVQIKRVQNGKTNFDYDDMALSVPLTYSVNQDKSLLLITASVDSNTNDQYCFFTAQFESDTSIQFNRAGASAPATIFWQVIEFSDGVNIQRGISSIPPGNGTSPYAKDITINSLTTYDQSAQGITYTFKAVPIVQAAGAYASRTVTQQFFINPSFPNATTLRLTRLDNVSSGSKSLNIV